MQTTRTFTGTSRECAGNLEHLITHELALEKPLLNNMIMVVEHLVSGFLSDKEATYTVDLTVDPDVLALDFKAEKVA